MSQAKRLQLLHDGKLYAAMFRCVEIGAIEMCKTHDEEFIDTLQFLDPNELTSKILEDNPDAIGAFDDREEMLKYVTSALDMAGKECGYAGSLSQLLYRES